jgi:teichuronic acid biosynthesis glycosyltransferase TuaG
MPAFNSAKTIAESITSVLSQTFQNWELIIINDGSDDETFDIAKSYSDFNDRIYILDLGKNSGLSNARNEGAFIAKGKYLTFLDSDDLWMPQKLSVQYNLLKSNPNCLISHTDYSIFSHKSKIRTPLKFFFSFFTKKRGDLFNQLLYFNSVGILTVMIEKKLFLDFKGFDSSLWGLEDYDLWLRISKNGYIFLYINQELSSYRLNPNGMMSNSGRYKRAYKNFLKKHKDIMIQNRKFNIARAYYYRYFGVLYFKKNQHFLSFLYLKKSVKYTVNLYFHLVTIPYLLISLYNNQCRLVRTL